MSGVTEFIERTCSRSKFLIYAALLAAGPPLCVLQRAWPQGRPPHREKELSNLLSRADIKSDDLRFFRLNLDLTVASVMGWASRCDVRYVEIFDVSALLAVVMTKIYYLILKKYDA